MTETVGAFEAKTHLSELLQKVEEGGTFVITRHGRPVARLVPIVDTADDARQKRERVIDGMLKMRKKYSLGKFTARELIDHGRKY